MRFATLLHLLAADSPPVGYITIGEGVALAIVTALVAWVTSVATTRSQVVELTRRIGVLEGTTSTLPQAIARIDENLAGLRRELHASGAFPRARDAE